MTGDYRLPPSPGERIDRSRTVRFTFEGREFEGFAGDTVASALAADGISTLSRSFKYRRPRGIFSLADRDTNALVQLPGEPNVPAAVREIEDGMEVLGQNYAGSLERDRGAWIGLFSRFLPVGFYYKAFYRPSGAWRRWEPVFRARAGLGAVDPDAEPGRFDKKYGFHDAVVVGAGPAGLAAAAAAAGAGADVLLVDDQPALGGALTHARFGVERAPQEDRLRALVATVEKAPNVEIVTGAVCEGWFADDWLAIVRGRRLHKVRAKRTIVATGAMEQPVVFRNNDLPGIMLPSAAQRLIRHYGVRPGNRAVVATSGRDGYAAALDLLDAGVDVAAVVDLRQHPDPSPEASAVAERGIRVLAGHTPSEAREARAHRPRARAQGLADHRHREVRYGRRDDRLRPGVHERRRHARRPDRLPRRSPAGLRPDAVRPPHRPRARRHPRRRRGQRPSRTRTHDRRRPLRGPGGGGRARPGGGKRASTPRRSRPGPQPRLADLRASKGQGVRRLRRGSDGPRPHRHRRRGL